MARHLLIQRITTCQVIDGHHEGIVATGHRAGHLGAQGGGGHYRVVVVSARFEGLSRVAAQRLVYQALGELMTTDIHALEMRTLTPEQWSQSGR